MASLLHLKVAIEVVVVIQANGYCNDFDDAAVDLLDPIHSDGCMTTLDGIAGAGIIVSGCMI